MTEVVEPPSRPPPRVVTVQADAATTGPPSAAPRPRAATRRMPTMRERAGGGLDNPILYDNVSTMSRLQKRWAGARGGDPNDPLVGMVKPLVMNSAGAGHEESDEEAVDYSQFTNADEAEALRVSKLKDMEGLFQIKVKETAKSGADVNADLLTDQSDTRKAASISRMLDELGRQQNKSDRSGWRLRYMRLTNNLTAGGGRKMWGPKGPPNRRPLSPTSTISDEGGGGGSYFPNGEGSGSPAGSPMSPASGSGKVMDANLSAYNRLNSPPESPLGSQQRAGSPTPAAPSRADIKLVRRGSGYFDGFAGKSVVDVDAAVLEVYHVDVDNASKTFSIRSKAMAIPLKCMTLVRRGKLEANRALEFPTDTPAGKEYKFGHLRLEVLFDTEVHSNKHHNHNNNAHPNNHTSGGSGDGQHQNALSGVFSSSPSPHRHGSPSSPTATAAAASGSGGDPHQAPAANKNVLHHELEIITSTATERDLWYDWISSFILHADLVDLHTDKERTVPQYVLRRPTKGVASFVDFFLSGKRKVDALNTVIGGISGLGGAIGAGFKPLMNSGVVKPPNQGEVFIVTPFGPQMEHRCRVSCPRMGEFVLTPLDVEDVDRVTVPLAMVDVEVRDPFSTTLFLTFNSALVSSAFVRQCGPILDADFDVEDPFEDDEYYDGPDRDQHGLIIMPIVELRVDTPYDRDQLADWFTKISNRNLHKSTPYVYERAVDTEADRFTFSPVVRSAAGSPNFKDALAKLDADEKADEAARNRRGSLSSSSSSSDDDGLRYELGTDTGDDAEVLGSLLAGGDWGDILGTAPHGTSKSVTAAATASAAAKGRQAKDGKHRHTTTATAETPQYAPSVPPGANRYHRSDARSVLSKTVAEYYSRQPRSTKGITLSAEVLKGELACIMASPTVLAALPPFSPDGSVFMNADLLDVLVRPPQGWAMVGYAEIGRVPSGPGAFTRRGVVADYAQQTIVVVEGVGLDDVCARVRFADITYATAYSRVFGSMGFTLHCLGTGVEVMIIPEDGSGSDNGLVRRWLGMLEMAGCVVRADATREEVNDRYLQELKSERAKLDAMQGVDLCESNVAMLLPCALCGKQSYTCDITGTFHPDAVRRLAVIDRQQQLQTRKTVQQQMEEDFASSSSSSDDDGIFDEAVTPFALDDDLLGGRRGSSLQQQQRREKNKEERKAKAHRPLRHPGGRISALPRLETWVLSSMLPEVRELPADAGTNTAYIDGVISNAMGVVAAAERSMKGYERLFNGGAPVLSTNPTAASGTSSSPPPRVIDASAL